MRCVMLAGLLYITGLFVLLLSLVAVPVDHCNRLLNRVIDWAEINYYLAVIERKTRTQVKRRWRGR